MSHVSARLASSIVLATVLLGLHVPVPGAAAAVDESLQLSRAIASRWTSLQQANGAFPDYVARARSRARHYGEESLGYGLLQAGVRDGDGRQVAAGLNALSYVARHPIRGRGAIFQTVFLAAAYNLVNERLASDAGARQAQVVWARRLRHAQLVQLGGTRPYYNFYLIEAVAVLELARTGLHSTVHRSILASPARAVGLAERLIKTRLPKLTTSYARRNPPHGVLTMLSDPPWNPPAYHAFSLALLARGIDVLGERASDASRELLVRAARASWALVAPDGDLSYFGRSQEQSWTLAMTAAGSEAAAIQPQVSPEWAARFRALSDRAVSRLGRTYAGGRYAIFITPALKRRPRGGVAGLDGYAGAVSYTGLTLVGLNWALEHSTTGDGGSEPVGADAPGSFVLSRGEGSFAVVRRPKYWYAIKQGPGRRVARSADFSNDLRYDVGLVALKVRGADGSFHDVLPLRPRARGEIASTGPLLLRHGRTGRPEGRRLRVSARGVVTLRGGFRTRGGRWLRRGINFRFTPTACGVKLTLPVRRRDRYKYSAILRRRSARVRSRGRKLVDRKQIVRFNRPARVRLRGRYGSGAEAGLVDARARFGPSRKRRLSITVCAR